MAENTGRTPIENTISDGEEVSFIPFGKGIGLATPASGAEDARIVRREGEDGVIDITSEAIAAALVIAGLSGGTIRAEGQLPNGGPHFRGVITTEEPDPDEGPDDDGEPASADGGEVPTTEDRDETKAA